MREVDCLTCVVRLENASAEDVYELRSSYGVFRTKISRMAGKFCRLQDIRLL